MTYATNSRQVARYAVIMVWIWTGIVSLLERHGQSLQLLQGTPINDATVQQLLIWAGAIVDLALGIGMALFPRQRMFDLALVFMAVMTLVATYLSPALWLHPLGPLLKNIPIAILLWQLRESTS